MGQVEILTFLYNKLAFGDDNYWTATEISKATGCNYNATNRKMKQLVKTNYITYKTASISKNVIGYRLKYSQLKKIERMVKTSNGA